MRSRFLQRFHLLASKVTGGPDVPDTRVKTAIGASHLAKRFGHVHALIDASISVRPGEVVALFGDNGAGKSTLLRCLQGIHQPDAGEVIVNDKQVQFRTIREAQVQGVDCVHQDLALAPDLSVVDNVFLGHGVTRRGLMGRLGVLARKEMIEVADSSLRDLSIKLPSLTVPVADLSGGQRQAVAVARAVMWAKTAVLMDEPTAALGARQSETVCELMRAVAARGLGVMVVSHDIPRVLAVADRVTVLWRGKTAVEAEASSLTVPDVVAAMVGYSSEKEAS
jgi:simple sugar transport system ATP-binding protein